MGEHIVAMVDNSEGNDQENVENGSGDCKKPYSFSVIPFSLEQQLEFIDISKDGYLLLGSSNMAVRNWIGSVWLFDHSDVFPTKEESVCGHGCESCVSCGQFLDSKDKVIIGEDTGALSILSIDRFEDSSTHFVPHLSEAHHDGNIVSISLSQDKQQTVSGGSDRRINIWDNNTLELQNKYSPGHSREVSCVRTGLEQGCPLFISTGLDGLALLWDPRLPKPASALLESKCGLTSLAWKSEKEFFVGSLGGDIILTDLRFFNEEVQRVSFSKYPVHRLAVDNGLLAACGETNTVMVWDCTSYELRYTDSRHTSLVRGLAWNPVNNKLYSCGFDKRIYSHDVTLDT